MATPCRDLNDGSALPGLGKVCLLEQREEWKNERGKTKSEKGGEEWRGGRELMQKVLKNKMFGRRNVLQRRSERYVSSARQK